MSLSSNELFSLATDAVKRGDMDMAVWRHADGTVADWWVCAPGDVPQDGGHAERLSDQHGAQVEYIGAVSTEQLATLIFNKDN